LTAELQHRESVVLERWSKWALAEADRIDPALGGGFLKAMHEE
jgi:hypothetical protein